MNDINEKLKNIRTRIDALDEPLATEEATKTALVMPFISALGYDVFDPNEVVPEFTADVGTKKGEKVDYAILKDREVILLMECKQQSVPLGKVQCSQLYRYFSVTNARLAILTNGVQYQFFTDLDEPNKMDPSPFMTLDMNTLRPDVVKEVSRLTKNNFQLEEVLACAEEMKNIREIKEAFGALVDDPDSDFVRLFFSRLRPSGSRFTQNQASLWKLLVKRACSEVIRERVTARLESAIQATAGDVPSPQEPEDNEDELSAFTIIKAMLAKNVEPRRLSMSSSVDGKLVVYVDEDPTKDICRISLAPSGRTLEYNDGAEWQSRDLDTIEDLYKHSANIRMRLMCQLQA